MRRVLKKFTDLKTALVRADKTEDFEQILQKFSQNALGVADQVSGALTVDDLVSHGLFKSVDKTQQKLKPAWPDHKQLDKLYHEVNVLLRRNATHTSHVPATGGKDE